MVAFSIFWRNIYRYWIFYLIWFLVSYCFLFFLWKKKFFHKFPKIQKLLENDLDSLFIVLILWVLIWWRLWHILIYDFHHYVWNRLEMFQIRKWWMSFIWWIVWVFLWTILFMHQKKFSIKESFILFDLLACIAPLCIALWRLGNFLNQELYWIPFQNRFWRSESTIQSLISRWFLHVYPNIDSILRINTNFLSIIFEWLLLFVVVISILVHQIRHKKRKIWKLSMCFLLRYSLVRFLLEYLRNDSQSEFIWWFSKSQRVFLCFIIMWIVWIYMSHKQPNENL